MVKNSFLAEEDAEIPALAVIQTIDTIIIQMLQQSSVK